MLHDRDQNLGTLIMLAQAYYNQATWWELTAAWLFGRHRIVRHLGWEGRVSFWRGNPYLLSFREVA